MDIQINNLFLYKDFKIICDESNNTNKTINDYEIHIDVYFYGYDEFLH